MAFTLWELSLLKDNKQKTVLVGYVPDVVATQMSLSMKEVYLSKQSMDHIFQEHPDINGFDLLHIPNALDHGMIVQEKAKPHCLIISYMDPDTHRRFVFAVKYGEGGRRELRDIVSQRTKGSNEIVLETWDLAEEA
jgi:hypothetical protein